MNEKNGDDNKIVNEKLIQKNIKKNDSSCKRHDVVISNSRDIKWKFKPYDIYDDFILSHDLITFKYTKNDHYLYYDQTKS